jgi:hypothetical protein
LIQVIALVLSVRGLPIFGVASMDLAQDRVTGTFTDAPNKRGLLQLAKHEVNDGDQGDEEDDHKHHYRHDKHSKAEKGRYNDQEFCGPYFKSSSVPYFHDYYSRDDYVNLPPGLRKHVQKTGHLPPGLEKKYKRTGQLPAGLQKRFECGQRITGEYSPYLYPVPEAAYEKVGPLPPDSKLYLYGQDLILLNDHTKSIIDVLRGAY